ncbi:MAG: hypothetical protein VYA55_17485 [Pseudomonadota bacterium]|nr:hypothetical protein [Pseudomonadota bacterium]
MHRSSNISMMMLAVMVYALSACGGGGSGSSADRNANQIAINGQVAIARSDSTFYSMEGADFAIYGLNKDLVLRGKQQVALGNGKVEQDGALRLAVPSSAIRDSRLYVVEITCPPTPPATTCAVEAPIHVMLSGRQLQQGNWTASALTEIVYQNLAYYVAAEYSADQLANIMNSMARWIFNTPSPSTITYQDLLRWHPLHTADYPPITRVPLFDLVLANLVSDFNVGHHKTLATQYINPVLSSVSTNGRFMDVAIKGEYAFVTDVLFGLRVYDISKVDSMAEVGSLGLSKKARDIVLYGDYAYLSAGNGVHVVSIQNPRSPDLIDTIPMTSVRSLAVSGQTLVISDREEGARILSIHNPRSPLGLSRHIVVEYEANSARFEDNILYALYTSFDPSREDSERSRLLVKDISQAAESRIYFGATQGHHLALLPGYLYVVGRDGIEIFDRSNPADFHKVGELPLRYSSSELMVVGDTAYLLESTGNIRIIDVSDPSTPEIIGRIITPSPNYGISAHDKLLYVAGGPSGLLAMDAHQFLSPISTPLFAVDSIARSTLVNNGNLYVVEHDFGVHTLNVNQPSKPAYESGYEQIESSTRDFVLNNGIGYVATDGVGVQAVDFSLPSSPILLGEYDAPDRVSTVLLEDNVAYLSALEQGLYVVDVSDPAQMLEISRLSLTGSLLSTAKIDDYLFASSGSLGLGIINISNLSDPQLQRYVDGVRYASHVARLGDFAYVAANSAGVIVLDIRDPSTPTVVTTIDTPGLAFHLAFDGQYAYVADYGGGVTVLDVSDASDPRLIGSADTLGYAYHVTAHGNNLYVSTSRGVERLSLIKQ